VIAGVLRRSLPLDLSGNDTINQLIPLHAAFHLAAKSLTRTSVEPFKLPRYGVVGSILGNTLL
jgi:hypothetical protein